MLVNQLNVGNLTRCLNALSDISADSLGMHPLLGT